MATGKSSDDKKKTVVMAGATVPETPHVTPNAALYRPRRCSGAISLTSADEVGDSIVSPSAKTTIARHRDATAITVGRARATSRSTQ